jgi:DNA helicase-2/ATP-dependent DNA helicase PcrA
MTAFDNAYTQLNSAQKQAVDTTEGPLLVIAGPGTGKTQLLSARVANILQKTDTPAQNILCLTFTENGAANMRERLTRFIGQEAYEVNINTYHAFGSDLIKRYPEYFWETRLQNSIDELSKHQLLLEIIESLSFKNPLRQTRHHIGDVISTISEVKRALLSSDDLRAIAQQNLDFIRQGNVRLREIFDGFTKMPSSLGKAAAYFEETLVALAPLLQSGQIVERYDALATLCLTDLKSALETAVESGKTKPLTVWKNKWLAKDADNHFIIAGELENRRLSALAGVVDEYQSALESQGLYDFDDMILRSITALEDNADLRYSLQEKYLYILLDEFQDTNAAQLRLIQLLTDNPVNEGRPNIMAVGDDDQAIYAFQGAQYSNMVEYYEMFRDTKVINLSKNYRSHAEILEIASNIASQITERLTGHFADFTKTLDAANPFIKSAFVERREFQSEIAERAWISSEIKRLIDAGTSPSEIAILAPKHKQIEPFVAYLNNLGIPVRYEKRENILDAPIVRQLITLSQLVLALASDEQGVASALWPQVLSYEFWQIPVADIWEISWRVSDSRRQTNETEEARPLTWSRALLASDNSKLRQTALVLLTTAGKVETENLESILDYLMERAPLKPAEQTTSLVTSEKKLLTRPYGHIIPRQSCNMSARSFSTRLCPI